MSPRDEETLRRSSWVPGLAVTMADFQTWWLPPIGDDMGSWPYELFERVKELAEADSEAPEGRPSAKYVAFHRLARWLLRRNYRLAEAECHQLLPFPDPEVGILFTEAPERQGQETAGAIARHVEPAVEAYLLSLIGPGDG
jgi:hypothetical protein